MTIVGKFLHWAGSVPAWISGVLNLADNKAKAYIPIAIKLVDGLKNVMANPATDMVTAIVETIIPGEADNIIIERAKSILNAWLPVILLKLKDANAIANIPNLQDQLKAALNELKFSSDAAKQMFWNDFAGLIVSEFTTGTVTLQQARVAVESYYQTYVVNLKKAA